MQRMQGSFAKNIKECKERNVFCKERKRTQRTQRTQHSYAKNIKESKERSVLFKKNVKERKEGSFLFPKKKNFYFDPIYFFIFTYVTFKINPLQGLF